MKNIYRIMVMAVILGLGVYLSLTKKGHGDLPLIAITQIIDHNTLNDVRQGLMDELKAQGFEDGKTAKIIFENANGNVSVAAEIASRFISLKPKVIVALATSSAQILMQPAQQANIPLVFSAVTDPVAARLVPSWSSTDHGVTGVSDYMDPEPQLEMILSFLPDLKHLGFIYNPAEVNSVSMLEKLEAIAHAKGITIVRSPLNNTSEASTATLNLVGKVEAIYFPNDNTAMAAAATIAQLGTQNRIPVFANDSASVKLGVLASLAFDRPAMGSKTGQIVANIMRGGHTGDFKVTNNIPTDVVINAKTQTALGINIPWNLAEKAIVVQ